KLTASDGVAADQFGESSAISGDTVVVGAFDDDGMKGSAYVFERNKSGADNWGEVKKLTASDRMAGDRFAKSLGISGDTVVVGAAQSDPNGAAYIFERNKGGTDNWGEVKKLTPSDPLSERFGGSSVGISTDTVVVGAKFDGFKGSAYVYERNKGGADLWGEVRKLTASDGAAGDQFGISVGISGDTVVLGADGDDSSKGSSYIFALSCNTPPTISAVPVTRTEAAPSANSTIANVSDPDQPANTLTVTVNGGATATVNGVTVSNITVDALGVAKADVVAACGATTATFTLKVTDNASAMATATLTVTVLPEAVSPIITCPANIAVGTGGSSAVVTYPAPTVSDSCPGVGAPVCLPASGSLFALGDTTVNCSVTDAAGNSASCAFKITVNAVTFGATDPLACTGPGNVVTATFTVTNNGAVAVDAAASVALPPGDLVAVPGTCTANIGTCAVVDAALVTYAGTLGPGQTATVSYQAQVGDGVVTGTVLCSNLSVSFGGGPSLTVQACLTATCPPVGPGLIPQATSLPSDQKAGSVLFYNLFASSASMPMTENTRISLTNIHTELSAFVHLFFVDGSTCSIADSFLCLTPNETASFLTSNLDPGTTGYIVAVAVNRLGCPIDFNYLIGDEYVKLSRGHAANLGAESISALAGGLPVCNSWAAVLSFDGISYNPTPRVLAVDNIIDRVSGNDTLLIVNRVGGDLSTGAGSLGSLFGLLFNDSEQSHSFSFNTANCQVVLPLSNDFPRTSPRFDSVILVGRSGWMKLWGAADIGILGAAINFNRNTQTSSEAFNQGHNLHKLRLTPAARITIPVFPPGC
ncbi:MAG: HYR domain-containing protein, partial [Acidobacteriota bacterium]